MRLPNNQSVNYLEPGVEIKATRTPPSMTYVDPSTQVTMKRTYAYITYLENNPVELEAPMAREVTNDVEIESTLRRTVVTDDPIRVELESTLMRCTSADVEITAPLVRNVTSYQVDLEYSTRRDVINSADLEFGLERRVEARVELTCPTARLVLNDEDGEIGVPTKEYGSFVEKNKLFRVQHDVLNEDVSDNPYFEKQISNLRNAALLTRNQTVIKAINELFVSQREAFLSTFTALEKVNATIGDLVEDRELRAKYAKIGATNIIDGLVKISDNIDKIIDFIGAQSGSIDYYEELGYTDLVDALRGMNEKIKSIDFNWTDITEDDLAWMFRSTDYIPEIKDQIFTLLDQMQEEIEAFRNGITRQFLDTKSETEAVLARQYQTLIEKMNSPYESVTKEEIREMFKTLGQEELPDEEEDVYFEMFRSVAIKLQETEAKFDNEILGIKQSLESINEYILNWADITIDEIRSIFDNNGESEEYLDVYLELYRSLSERLNEQESQFDDAIARLQEDLLSIQNLDDWANIGEKEIKWLFGIIGPDVEPDEDPYASLFEALSARIDAQRERLDQHIEDARENQDDYANITMEEIQKIFAALQSDESELTFEERIVALINNLSSRVDVSEQTAEELRQLVEKLNTDSADITEEEVRRIFAILAGEETEETYEDRISDIISTLTARIIAQEEESVRLNQKIDDLELQIDGFSRGLDMLSRQISSKFEAYSARIDQKVRYILSALETAQDVSDGTVTYETLVAYLETEMQDIKTSLGELDNRVTKLETQAEDTFTVDDVCSEADIIAMFPGYTGDEVSGYAMFVEASEEQIRDMFKNYTIGDVESGEVNIKDILDLIVTEEDVLDIFRPYLPEGTEVHTMEEFLEALANRNNNNG